MAIVKHLVRSMQAGGLILLSFLSVPLALGQDNAADEAATAIREVLEGTQPNISILSVTPSPVPGLYEVRTNGMGSIYASEDARYFIPGDLYEMHAMGLVNHSEIRRNGERIEKIAAVPREELITYPAKGETKATLYVFTDVDCPYCRQLHGDMDILNANGVQVHYLAFPRRGMDHETADKMISAWCADNRQAIFTSAKRGADIPSARCDNPVARHYALGQEVGVQGTPALIMEDGYIINGYMPADTLLEYLLADESP